MPQRIDALEAIVEAHTLLLNDHTILIQGIRQDVDSNRDRSIQAVSDIEFTRLDNRSYTDYRFTELWDHFNNTLTHWVQNIIDTAGNNARGYADDAAQGVRDDLDGWSTDIEQRLADAEAAAQDLHDWAVGDLDAEMQDIREFIIQAQERAAENEQEILNEADQSRREVAEMAARWREIADEIAEHRNRIINMDYSIYEVHDSLTRTLNVEFDGRFSSFEERINVAAGEIGAVADRVTTLRTDFDDQYAQVQTLERALVDEFEQVAQQITSLSVGTNTQFDPFRIWHFDEDAEGWSGTWNDGYLTLSGSHQSPLFSMNAGQYRQIRGRIRRIGLPTWNISVTWQGATPNTSINIIEPAWAGDNDMAYGEFTVNPTWNGTLTRLIINSSGTNSTDYYELDWITVGRPAPGASTADLNTERQARIAQGEATAHLIDNINLRLTSGDGVLGVASDVTSGLRASIVEDAVTGAVTSINEDITLLETSINNLETGQQANSSAVSALQNRVDTTEDGIVAVNSRIDNLTFDIEGIVNSTAFQALTQRVEQTEDEIVATNSSITNLNTTISSVEGNVDAAQLLAQNALNTAGNKGRVFVQNAAPPVAERLPQNLWIDTTGGGNTPKRWNGQQWQAVTDKVARDAAAAAASALAGLGDKADVAALTALTTDVNNLSGQLSSQASSITTLGSTITLVQNDADDARQAAQEAFDLADGKGRVLFQTTVPNASYRSAANLWIDTTSNNNTPRRWSGSTTGGGRGGWVVVTDKVATDAAAAALAAQNAVALKADSSAVDSLTTRVEQTESGIVAEGSRITSLTSTVESVGTQAQNAQTAAQAASTLAGSKGKVFFQATAPGPAERLAQNLWIDTTNGENRPRRWNGTSWQIVRDKAATDALAAANEATAGLARKADNSVVDAIDTKIEETKGDLVATTNRVSATETRVNNAISRINTQAGQISNIRTNITDINGIMTAQSEQINNTYASLNNFSANGLFRVRALATPAGAQSRIALVATATSGEGNARNAGIYLEAHSGNMSRVIVRADSFYVTNNASDNVYDNPFLIQNGMVYIKSAVIQDLSVDTIKIAAHAVIEPVTASSTTIHQLNTNGTWVDILSITFSEVTNRNTSYLSAAVGVDGLGLSLVELRFLAVNANTGARTQRGTGQFSASGQRGTRITGHIAVTTPNTGLHRQYILQARRANTGDYQQVPRIVSTTIIGLNLKR